MTTPIHASIIRYSIYPSIIHNSIYLWIICHSNIWQLCQVSMYAFQMSFAFFNFYRKYIRGNPEVSVDYMPLDYIPPLFATSTKQQWYTLLRYTDFYCEKRILKKRKGIPQQVYWVLQFKASPTLVFLCLFLRDVEFPSNKSSFLNVSKIFLKAVPDGTWDKKIRWKIMILLGKLRKSNTIFLMSVLFRLCTKVQKSIYGNNRHWKNFLLRPWCCTW